jgi:hypothetical protein
MLRDAQSKEYDDIFRDIERKVYALMGSSFISCDLFCLFPFSNPQMERNLRHLSPFLYTIGQGASFKRRALLTILLNLCVCHGFYNDFVESTPDVL